MTTKRKLPKRYLECEVRVETFNPENRTVEIVWSEGHKGLRSTWGGKYFESLSMEPSAIRMDRLKSGRAPLLDSHWNWSLRDQIGVVEDAWIANGRGYARVRLSEREEIQGIVKDIAGGIIRNVSVGYAIHKFEKLIEKDPANPDQDIRHYRAVDWEPLELSFVPIGFDPAASSRANTRAVEQEEEFECLIEGEEEMEMATPGAGVRTMANDNTPCVEGVRDMTTKNQTAGDNELENARAQAVASERERIQAIKRAAKAAGMEEAFTERMVSEGRSLEETSSLIFDELEKRTVKTPVAASAPVIEGGMDEAEKFRDGASQWILQRAGLAPLIEKHEGKKLNPGEFRGMSLVDIARETLVRAGVRVRGMDQMTLVGKAFAIRSLTGVGNTVGDFPIVLESTLHKVLLASYATTPDTWARFCKKGSVSDFRPHPRYRMGSFGRLDKLTATGEFTRKQVSDAEKSQIQAGTVGNIIGLNRHAIVNDDLGVFSDLAVGLGRAAKLSIEMDVYDLLAANPLLSDGKALFHDDHKNIGVAAVPSVASVDAGRVLMASQTDHTGNEILDLRPAVWLGPVALGGTARVINQAEYDPDTANKLHKPNKVRGLFSDIVDTARLTGTAWYTFADPNVAPVIEVVFLDGQEMPFLENQEGFTFDGVNWKVRHDYGTGAVDYRGATRNAGAAQ